MFLKENEIHFLDNVEFQALNVLGGKIDLFGVENE